MQRSNQKLIEDKKPLRAMHEEVFVFQLRVAARLPAPLHPRIIIHCNFVTVDSETGDGAVFGADGDVD